jgi:deoxyribonuclease (pyrimidine dimer)
MTRINVVPVQILTDKHLLAEYKEITRPFNKAYKRLQNDNLNYNKADSYLLNTGHESFFFDKLLYLHNRYDQLKVEMCLRGFNVNLDLYHEISEKFKLWFEGSVLWNDYQPRPEDIYLSMARLVRRCNIESVNIELASNN